MRVQEELFLPTYRVLDNEPVDIFLYRYKASLLEQLGRDEEALALYYAFIAAHPTDLQGYFQNKLY